MNEKIKDWIKASIGVLNGSVPPILALGAGGVLIYHCATEAIGSQPAEYWAVTGAMLSPYIGKFVIGGVKKVIRK